MQRRPPSHMNLNEDISDATKLVINTEIATRGMRHILLFSLYSHVALSATNDWSDSTLNLLSSRMFQSQSGAEARAWQLWTRDRWVQAKGGRTGSASCVLRDNRF